MISSLISSIEPSNECLELFEYVSEQVFKERKTELDETHKSFDEHLKELDKKEKDIINNLDKFLSFEHILKLKNEELDDIKKKKAQLEIQKKQ
jgi:hypothetical protein